MTWTTSAAYTFDARSIRMRAQRQSFAAQQDRPPSREQMRSRLDRGDHGTGRGGASPAPEMDGAMNASAGGRARVRIPSVDELSQEMGLTPREAEIARLLVWGDSNKAIARKLEISAGTVRKHVEHVLRKVGACSRRAVTRQVLGLAEPA